MKTIDIISATPELLISPFSGSIMKRAIEKEIVQVNFHDLKDYSNKKRKQIDDYQYGGGSGMVLMIEPIDNCISHLKKDKDYSEIIFMTPDAEKLITMELSIGDYVLSGGELPAAVLCDSIIRLIPGVLNNETSALEDSFQDNSIAPPVYTRPASYKNMDVPEVLISGDSKKIDQWREGKSDEKTKLLNN